MRLAMPLRVEGVVSSQMLAGARRFMEIIHGWSPEFRPVPIEVDEVRPSLASGRQVATFFSAGVDSFYTVLTKGRADVPPDRRISTLIYLDGFDVHLDDVLAREGSLAGVSAAAAGLGKELLCISTNLRQATRRICRWDYYHGQLLASSALGVAGLLGRVYVPSTYDSSDPTPHGSHPQLDPLWSTETLQFDHDGFDVPRTQKVMSQVSHSPVALKHLRVCVRERGARPNCGRCSQCMRTKINLAIAGVLDQCRTFDTPLACEDVGRMTYAGLGGRSLARDNLRAAIAHGADPELTRALQRSLSLSVRFLPRYWPIYAKTLSRAFRRRLLGGILEKATWQRWLKE
jgi:hypothetical protein